LLDHLVETSAIVRRWNQPRWLQDAALIHSVYATDVYHHQLIPVSQRAAIADLVGAEAERLAFLFAAVSREALFERVRDVEVIPREKVELPSRAGIEERAQALAAADLGHLLLLHIANHAEQVRDSSGGPAAWLSRVSGWATKLDPEMVIVPPAFANGHNRLRAEEERSSLVLYRVGVHNLDDLDSSRQALMLAAEKNPWVGEPCAWLGLLALRSNEAAESVAWSAQARERLRRLGVAWDGRMNFDRWLASVTALERLAQRVRSLPKYGRPAAVAPEPRTSPAASTGPLPRRLQRYLASIADGVAGAGARVYPDLPSQSWYDPAAFPITTALTDAFQEIREEIAACDQGAYHRESEAIRRTGSWDVLMFYERGKRNDALCDVCPTTTTVVEGYETVRTLAGLAYVSRLRPGTHIAAHRGPTNLRVRCHLGLQIPDGDCRLRVGQETHTWTEGACVVFDDYIEHEAWNAAESDRIVLVVDLWHPDLSHDEVRYLDGLHRYAMAHALSLHRYWDANRGARTDLYH
jgi:aspartate beta-hydroxylase